MIKPTVGRVVWFWPEPPKTSACQPCSAQVAFVHSDRMINVGGFDHNGKPIAATSVPLLQDEDFPPAHGPYACWMPYQKAVASGAQAPTLHA